MITAAISPYREIRDEARQMMDGRFIETYVKASVEVCEERDVKGLYAKARSGEIKEFTGVSDPYEPPESPELVLDTEHQTPEESAQQILDYLESSGLLAAAAETARTASSRGRQLDRRRQSVDPRRTASGGGGGGEALRWLARLAGAGRRCMHRPTPALNVPRSLRCARRGEPPLSRRSTAPRDPDPSR